MTHMVVMVTVDTSDTVLMTHMVVMVTADTSDTVLMTHARR